MMAEGKGTPVIAELTEDERVEQKEQKQKKLEERLAKLDDFGQSLAKTRSEAIAARRTSGIEDIWLEDEEFYEGCDAENRNEARVNWRTKPPGQSTAASAKTTRSTVFPNITGPFTDAAAARIADMLLPTDDRSWGLNPTPIPDMAGIVKGKWPKEMLAGVASMYPGQPKQAQVHIAKATQEAVAILDAAKEQSDKAQKRIEDWHVECQWHAQVRMVIEDAARIGVGVLKGPVPVKKTIVMFKDGALQMISEIKPGSKWVDPWNFYPDAACGESLHNGSYTWEKDYLARKQLRELKGNTGYIDEQIDRCLTEGPLSVQEYKETPDPISDPNHKDKFEVWYFHGTAEKDDLEVAGCDCEGVTDPHMPAMVTMVNNRVIRASLNPLDTGDFPYDVMVWRRRSGHWTGIGVARQIRTPQRMVTAATRHLMDNAGIAAGPMLVFKQGVVYPADGVAGIGPRKVYYIAEDADEVADATKAIGVIKVDMLVDELTKIIDLGLRFAEDTTGLPMLLQGQLGKAPDTVGGMQLLNNNASAVLRRLARLFDDRITEPHVRRYYHWLLQYGKDDEKGDYCIDARGSSALVERDIQNQELAQLGAIVVNPVFGKDPKKWMDEYLKSRHFDPRRFAFDDEKWQQIVENMAKGPQDPRMAVEQIRVEHKERLARFEADTHGQLIALEQQFAEAEKDKDRQLELMLKAVDTEVDARRQSGERVMNVDDIKAMLASTAMKLRTQKELSVTNVRARQVTKPPTEPRGRAPKGQAFQR